MAIVDAVTGLSFSIFENKGIYALLLGSGLSRSAQIPTGWEITIDLIRRVAALEGATEETDWVAWYRQRSGKEPDYSEVLDQLTTVPDERRSILHRYIEANSDDVAVGRKVPTKAHHAIAWLVREGFIRVIVTTNFDRLLESALRAAGIEPIVIRSDDDLRGSIPMVHARCFIVKVHGDYLDARIKNTGQELSEFSPAMNALLDRIFDDHGLIVCGWSSDWDHALRAALIRTPNRRFPIYWTLRGPASTGADDLIRHRAAQAVSIADADSFFVGLQEKIAAQDSIRRPNPRSVEILIATTKRLLSRSDLRIQMNDLLAEEQKRLTARIGARDFPRSGSGTAEEFRLRVSRSRRRLNRSRASSASSDAGGMQNRIVLPAIS
jgi:SIR2-like domain